MIGSLFASTITFIFTVVSTILPNTRSLYRCINFEFLFVLLQMRGITKNKQTKIKTNKKFLEAPVQYIIQFVFILHILLFNSTSCFHVFLQRTFQKLIAAGLVYQLFDQSCFYCISIFSRDTVKIVLQICSSHTFKFS